MKLFKTFIFLIICYFVGLAFFDFVSLNWFSIIFFVVITFYTMYFYIIPIWASDNQFPRLLYNKNLLKFIFLCSIIVLKIIF